MDTSSSAAPSAVPVELSVVVLAWDNLELTTAFVDSVRRNTDVAYELVIVDNGSRADAKEFARTAADRSVLNAENLGFARGMNQGLDASRGEVIAFCNNDVEVPAGWAARLLETVRGNPNAAIIVPAITAAPNPVTVRSAPGTAVEVLDPFSAPPAAVVYVMRRDTMLALGRWEEEYEIASGEDVDLCFKAWVNDLDIVFDERVLVDHVGHATASKLDDSERLWARNRRRFLAKWEGRTDPPRLASCDQDRFDRNRATARAVAGWMDQYFTIRDRNRENARNASGATKGADPARALRSAVRRVQRALGLGARG